MPTANLTSEKNWWSVLLTPIQVLPSGRIVVSSTKGLKVKQLISLSKVNIPAKLFQIKKVYSDTEFVVGEPDRGINSTVVPTEYNGGSAAVNQQQRNTIAEGYVIRSVYEEEPTMALRTIPVDWLGNEYTKSNPFPVDAVINLDSNNPGVLHIQNVIITQANTEYSITVPDKTIQFGMRSRTPAKIQYTFTLGESGSKFWTLPIGTVLEEKDLFLENTKIYLRTNKPTVIEFKAWVQ